MRLRLDGAHTRLLLTRGLTAGLLLAAAVQARHVSHGPAAPGVTEVVTGFRFRDAVLTVDDSLPTGTVIAVVPLAARTLPVAVIGRSYSQLTFPLGWDATWQAIPTTCPGVGVRLVPLHGEEVALPETGTRWYRGALRLELVKTGHVVPGRISDLDGLPVWELVQVHDGRRVVRARETLRLLRPLRIRSRARTLAAHPGSVPSPDA